MSEKLKYVCQNCGAEYPRWEGRCKNCGEWNTLVETLINTKSTSKSNVDSYKPVNVKSINLNKIVRIETGIEELDRTIGGGFIDDQVVLLSGEPGIGKSTLLLQIIEGAKLKTLYISGEESEQQVALRASRLGINTDSLDIISSQSIDELMDTNGYKMIVVDSIQTIRTNKLHSQIGSISQIKEATNMVTEYCKTNKCVCLIVAHINKSGDIAGPKLLEHLVDTVLYLEGDRNSLYRLLRVKKNRFGDSSEVGLFEMKEAGLDGVSSDMAFLQDFKETKNRVGSSIGMALEGTRIFPIEIQALVNETNFGYPKRSVSGYSINRLNLLIAVLQKHMNLKLDKCDVYLNIPSGISIKEPGLDLSVCAAIYSSYKNKPIKQGHVFFGEVGLSSEIRNVAYEARRLSQSDRLGFSNILSKSTINSLSQISSILLQ